MTLDDFEQQGINRLKENLPERIHAFALGTGYVESASNSKLLLIHREGFDSLFEAFQSLRECCIKAITEGYYGKKNLSPEDLNSEIQELMHEYIHGIMDGNSDFWKYMDCAGWEQQYMITKEAAQYTWLSVDCSPEIISIEHEFPQSDEDEFDFWRECWLHVHV